MKQKSFIVEPDGRHGGDRQCFYCQSPVGTEHRAGCVQRHRTVVIEATFTLVREVPEDWEPHMIEFQLNDSSWCASNMLGDLEKLDEADGRCLCSQFRGRYVREATPEDEVELGHTQGFSGVSPALPAPHESPRFSPPSQPPEK
jgi:hypothetical protein